MDCDDARLILPHNSLKKFNPIQTWKLAIFELLLVLSLAVCSYLPYLHDFPGFKKCDFLPLVLLIQSVFWGISLGFDYSYKKQHHTLKVNGYFMFYQLVSKCTKFISCITSIGNVVLLIICSVTFYKYVNLDDACSMQSSFPPYIAIIVTITSEVFILIPLLSYYTAIVWKFNAECPVSDVKKMSFWIPESSSSVIEIGNSDNKEEIHDLLQKQADLIQYYKEKIYSLNEKIMKFSHTSLPLC